MKNYEEEEQLFKDYAFDLIYNKNAFQHCLVGHFNVDEEQLQERIKEEDITAATSFYGDYGDFCDMLYDVLIHEYMYGDLASWIDDAKDTIDYGFYFELSHNITAKGYLKSYGHNLKDEIKSTNTAKLILVKTNADYCKWIIKTAYPIFN